MKWFISVAFLFLFAQYQINAAETPPSYLIPATETELVYSLQRFGYPVTEVREEIELDVEEATMTGRNAVSPKLKKITIAAKPGMYLVRTERVMGPFAGAHLLAGRASDGLLLAGRASDGSTWFPSLARYLLPTF